jgi:transposase
MSSATAYPHDIEACHRLLRQRDGVISDRDTIIADCRKTIAAKDALVEQQNRQLEAQKAQLAKVIAERDLALQRAFRKKSERYLADPKQFVLDFGDTPDVVDAAEGIADAAEEHVAGYRRRKKDRKPRNEQLPAHLPRYEVTLDVPDDKKSCPEHGARQLIGYDRLETLEIIPISLCVRVTLIPKYICSGCPECGVFEAARPNGLVEGNRFDTSIAAEIAVAKYGYHQPIYRQQDLFAACGWTPARSTLLNIQKAAAHLMRPLVAHLREVVRAGPIIGTDDTTVTLVVNDSTLPTDHENTDPDPKNVRAREVIASALAEHRGSITARMWAYRSLTQPINVFDFTVSRHRDGPALFLDGFEGSLMADCYSGYEAVRTRSDGKIIRAACVSHARRKVLEAIDNDPVRSAFLLAMFGELYDIEDRAKLMTVDERRALRQAEAKPIWERMRDYLASDAVAGVMPKEALGKAITYIRNQFEHLMVYLDDGLMPIDNNETEQLMKQVALGRKNWLFIGSVAAGYRAADLMTLVSSAVRNDLDVFAYLKDVLDRLLAGDTDYAAMQPDAWKQSHPEAIRQYRVEERLARADAKMTKRAKRRTAAKR